MSPWDICHVSEAEIHMALKGGHFLLGPRGARPPGDPWPARHAWPQRQHRLSPGEAQSDGPGADVPSGHEQALEWIQPALL